MIFHYTSQEGFKGIVQDDGIHLWLSDARYMNDKSEINYAVNSLIKVAEKFRRENRINSDVYEEIVKINDNPTDFAIIQTYYGLTNDGRLDSWNVMEDGIVHKYICSFSKEQDSLPMWKCYLKNDNNGYAIGLNEDMLKMYSGKCINGKIADVIYDDDRTFEVYESYLERFCANMNSSITDEDRKEIWLGLKKFIEESAILFKHPKFAYENEVRLIATIKSSKSAGEKEENHPKIKFRSAPHGLRIPYTEIHIPNKDILSAIIISPQIGGDSDEKITIESVRTYLKRLGYKDDIEIRYSEIPLRY